MTFVYSNILLAGSLFAREVSSYPSCSIVVPHALSRCVTAVLGRRVRQPPEFASRNKGDILPRTPAHCRLLHCCFSGDVTRSAELVCPDIQHPPQPTKLKIQLPCGCTEDGTSGRTNEFRPKLPESPVRNQAPAWLFPKPAQSYSQKPQRDVSASRPI